MTGFDWRKQVEATPGDWLVLSEPREPKPPVAPTRPRPTFRRERLCTRDEQRAIQVAYAESSETVAAIARRFAITPATVRRYVKGVR